MRNFTAFYLSLGVFLTISCSSPKPLMNIPADVSYYGIDFTRYSANGFFISPEYYKKEYTPVGLVAVEIYPRANYHVISVTQDVEGRPVKNYAWSKATVEPQAAIDSLVDMSIEMGADALVDFRYSSISRSYSSIPNPITLTGFRVEGFAIKREE